VYVFERKNYETHGKGSFAKILENKYSTLEYLNDHMIKSNSKKNINENLLPRSWVGNIQYPNRVWR
jgi:hypothetical protein